jgi:hypothetical protein
MDAFLGSTPDWLSREEGVTGFPGSSLNNALDGADAMSVF